MPVMERLLLQTSESSASPDHGRHHPVALGKSKASLVQGEERTGFPHPNVYSDISGLKGVRQEEFREEVNRENRKRVTCLHL